MPNLISRLMSSFHQLAELFAPVAGVSACARCVAIPTVPHAVPRSGAGRRARRLRTRRVPPASCSLHLPNPRLFYGPRGVLARTWRLFEALERESGLTRSLLQCLVPDHRLLYSISRIAAACTSPVSGTRIPVSRGEATRGSRYPRVHAFSTPSTRQKPGGPARTPSSPSARRAGSAPENRRRSPRPSTAGHSRPRRLEGANRSRARWPPSGRLRRAAHPGAPARTRPRQPFRGRRHSRTPDSASARRN